MKPPCVNCPCIPICKNRGYLEIFGSCTLVKGFLPGAANLEFRDGKKLLTLYKVLKPNIWWLIYRETSLTKKYFLYVVDKESETIYPDPFIPVDYNDKMEDLEERVKNEKQILETQRSLQDMYYLNDV